MTDFSRIDEARKLLGLGEYATFREIKEAYRKMVMRYHPDKCKENDKKMCKEMFMRIEDAHNVLKEYCELCNFSFKEQDVKRNTSGLKHEDYIKRFYSDWMGNVEP